MKKSEFADELGYLLRLYRSSEKEGEDSLLMDLAAAFCFLASSRGISRTQAIEFLYESLDSVRQYEMMSSSLPKTEEGVYIIPIVGEA